MLRLRHLVKFYLGTQDWAWVFRLQTEAPELTGTSDSDWAHEPVTRRSVSSGYVALGGHILEFWTVGQQLVALSSGEAEFYASGSAAARVLFFLYLLRELGRLKKGVLRSDSSAARTAPAGKCHYASNDCFPQCDQIVASEVFRSPCRCAFESFRCARFPAGPHEWP